MSGQIITDKTPEKLFQLQFTGQNYKKKRYESLATLPLMFNILKITASL